MTIRQLEVFLGVTQAKSFSRAAERIHLSQPTLSEHMRELEGELGVRLFVRHPRSVSLTEAGRIFGDYATRVVATLIARFRDTYPGITVALRIANSRIVEERVRDGDVDVAVIGGHILGPGERCVDAGIVDELQLIVSAKHPVGSKISRAKLSREPLLIREEGSATRQVTERALREAGITIRPTMELDHTETIKRAVLAGLGIAFVSRYAIEDEVRARRLRVVAVERLKIRRHFHVIHDERRPLSASARAFVDFLEKRRS